MKFTKGQKVTIIPLQKRGDIVHAFIVKVYGQPDVAHYNIRVMDQDELYEVAEEDLT